MSELRSPIGILDSGFGGLSVALAVRAAMPAEDLVFAADCAFAPWGDRGADFIDQRVHAIVDFLRSERIKALVLACNTATAVSIDTLRTELSIPVVGIEPAVFPGVRETETGVVGTLATVRTIASERYRHLSANALAWAKENRPMPVSILDCPCPGLMECVERGEFKSAHTLTLLEHYIAPLLAKGTDRLVLGCTHYPFLHEAIEAIIRKLAPEKRVELIDPDAVRRLVAAGVRLIGVDVPSIDPVESEALPAHRAALSYGVPILENLNLCGVDSGFYELMAFPMNWPGAEASPVRAVLRTLDAPTAARPTIPD